MGRKTALAWISMLAASLAGAALAADPPLPPGGAAILMWTPEQKAWGYRNMEKINPYHVVKRGDHVRELPAGPAIDPHWSWKGQDYDVAGYMAQMQTSGVMVLKDGRIRMERYGLGRTAQDRGPAFSVAKSMTATLIGAAVKDGYIKSLDDPVTTYIPELKGGGYEGVTVRQLITMTSGVKWNEDYSDLNSDVAKVGFATSENGMNPVVSYMRHLPRETAPGSKFVYKTGETDLAGILLSNAVGRPMSEYLSDKVWKPFGMEQDAIWMDDAAGHERGGCCMSMTLRDYARIGQFMLEDGVANGARVLPEGWVADATSPHVTFPPGGGETGYGYFWWLIPNGYAAEGIFGQQIIVYPKEHIVIAINSAWPSADAADRWAAQGAFAEAVRAALK